MRRINTVRLTGLLAVASLATTAWTGTGDQSSTAAAPGAAQASLSGTWTGTWRRTSQPPGGGTYTITLTQTGTKVSGTIEAQGSACLTKHPLIGTISGDAILLHVSDAGVKADYTGKVTGTSMSGAATVSCSIGVGTADWKVTKH